MKNYDENININKNHKFEINNALFENINKIINEDKMIGKGGFGYVYQGKFINFNVAVKMQRIDNYEESLKEVLTLINVNSPFFPRYIHHYFTKRDLFIIIEMIKGADMNKVLNSFYNNKNIIVDLNDLIKIKFALDMTYSLRYLHDLIIIHRDIKPSNYLFDSDTFRIKLTDFGISRIYQSNSTQYTKRKGTPHYYSPENVEFDDQQESSEVRINQKSDVWSLGLVLNELFTGDFPWKNNRIKIEDDLKIITLLINKEQFKLSENLKNEKIKNLILNCLKYKRSERYDSTQVMYELLKCLYMNLKSENDLRIHLFKHLLIKNNISPKGSKLF